MKVEITRHQMTSLMELVDEMSAMSGGTDDEVLEKENKKRILLADRFFKRNGFKRDFN